MNAGIDFIGLAVPPTYFELSDLAKARGVDPEKFSQGLGVLRMGIPLPDEDTVTLAARASQTALEGSRTSASEIGLCVVGTETAVDHSKPVSSFLQGLLKLPRSCRVYETKHACYGGTAALWAALDWIWSGSAVGKKALIVCSDIARYGLHSAGEPTQGAGAVALVVSASPALLRIEQGKVGTFSSDVFDFWRPLYSKDAVVDGHYSVSCYLEALEGAYKHYQERSPKAAGGFFSDQFRALAYHVPYCKMAKKAHRHLRGLDGDPAPDQSFERMVQASLALPSQVGNIYTGSLYLSVASLLSASSETLDGARLGLFSYGSGYCAEFFSAQIEPGAQKRLQAARLFDLLEQRRRLSLEEYEDIMRQRERMDDRAAQEAAREGFAYLGVEGHRRIYRGK